MKSGSMASFRAAAELPDRDDEWPSPMSVLINGGPEICPHPCADCPDGRHHWIGACVDPEDPEDDYHGVLAYDAEHGTDHALGYYGCKHCPAWIDDTTFSALSGEAPDAR